MDKKMKNILILTVDAGFGHRATANAVAEALNRKYGETCNINVVNPLDDKRVPSRLRDIQYDYDRMIRDIPFLYKLGYDALDAKIATSMIDNTASIIFWDLMIKVLEEYQPDVILSTFPIFQKTLIDIFDFLDKQIPVITIVTDLVSVHTLWFNRRIDYCLVATEAVKKIAITNGVPENKILITGIPAHPQIIQEQRTKQEIRKELDLDPDLPTFLAVGSKRVAGLLDTLNVLNHMGYPLQIIAVAGKDEILFQDLQSMDWHVPVKLIEYTKQMPMLMKASDAIISKAGGLITTESLAAGLPILLIDVLPGQEEGNARYVVSNGAGDLSSTPVEALEIVSHWLSDDQKLLKQRTKNAIRIGKPNAAFEIADLLVRVADEQSDRDWFDYLKQSVNRFIARDSNLLGLKKGKKYLTKAIVAISSSTEWEITKNFIVPDSIEQTPYGEAFTKRIRSDNIIFFQSGWGKVSASSSTQYAINRWNPMVIFNIGTCGGFDGETKKGDIILVKDTYIYDIIEKMGNPEEAIQRYKTEMDLTFLKPPYPQNVIIAPMVSADQDLDPALVPLLKEKYGAIAGDWESGAIAWAAKQNNTSCIILRGVSDIVGDTGSETYGNEEAFFQSAEEIMHALLQKLPLWLAAIETKSLGTIR
jgi:1,2-diacylglycerol 3-beta-galactosyltransferase